MKYLVDANVLSEATKPKPSSFVVSWLRSHEADLAVDATILGEVRFGILLLPAGHRRKRLEQWFDEGMKRITCVPFDGEAGLRWAALLAKLRNRGESMPGEGQPHRGNGTGTRTDRGDEKPIRLHEGWRTHRQSVRGSGATSATHSTGEAVKAILLIDHGSRRDAANEMMDCMANLVQAMAGHDVIARYAHMELAEPSIEAGLRSCVDAGATEVICFPYMLSPGKHSTGDIPRMVAAAAGAYPSLQVRVTNAFGVHEKLAELILGRAGLPVVNALSEEDATRCWHSSRSGTACGDACRCHPVTSDSAPLPISSTISA